MHRVELEAVEKEPQVVHGNLKKLRGSEFPKGRPCPVGWESDGKWLVSIDLIVISEGYTWLHEFLEGWPTT